MDRNPSVSMLALNILMMAGGTDISCLAGSASVEAVSLDEVSSGLIGVSSDSMLASASAFVRVLFVETAFLPGDRFSVSLDAAADAVSVPSTRSCESCLETREERDVCVSAREVSGGTGLWSEVVSIRTSLSRSGCSEGRILSVPTCLSSASEAVDTESGVR